ncbi:MAG: ATP synthase F1 subunit gamma [Parcubacteria group bacterium]|nr:ATP synthase F1 subunit gamma [Parcubacteria group bacterium]
MAVQTRVIKRRIKSVTNTRKITKAMEMVAASKMRKAVNSVIATRPYAKLAWDTVLSIGDRVDTSMHPLLHKRDDVKKVLLLLITSDRGLAGGFNTNIVRKTRTMIQELGDGVEIETVCIGKRGADAMRRMNIPIKASFVEITNNTKFEEVLPIGRMVIEEFTKGDFDKVLIAYTDFISALNQKPLVLQLLPLGNPEDTSRIGDVSSPDQDEKSEKKIDTSGEYTFEPSPEKVLDQILPRLVETMVYQAVLESAASEHSARMMAMRSASDAAGDMIDDLTFTFNQARQAGITQEIAEISSGKAALEG